MPHGAEESCQIVMLEVPEPARADAAMFLSGCFSLPPASTRSIAASGPIALLADLGKGQAEAVVAELRPSLPDGVVLEIRPGDDGEFARLQWPRPPRIYGRDVEDFAVAADVKCPVCGGMIRIVKDRDGLKAVALHAFQPAPADDRDPLFSGVKPLAAAASGYASLRSLQAGDTGFWMDNKGVFSAAAEERDAPPASVPAETSHSKRARSSAGLAAFMKPGAFSIVVARSRDPQVVKMIAEIMGVPEAEARDKCLSPAVTPVRGISLDEAQSLLARLRNLGARARIVRPA